MSEEMVQVPAKDLLQHYHDLCKIHGCLINAHVLLDETCGDLPVLEDKISSRLHVIRDYMELLIDKLDTGASLNEFERNPASPALAKIFAQLADAQVQRRNATRKEAGLSPMP